MKVIIGIIFSLLVLALYVYVVCFYIPKTFKEQSQIGKAVWLLDDDGKVVETFIKDITYNDKKYMNIENITTDDGHTLTFVDYLEGLWGFHVIQ